MAIHEMMEMIPIAWWLTSSSLSTAKAGRIVTLLKSLETNETTVFLGKTSKTGRESYSWTAIDIDG